MELTINTNQKSDKYKVSTKEELEGCLKKITRVGMTEVWLTSEEGYAQAMFTNNDKAMLMFIPKDSGAGFSSRDENSEDTQEVPIFMLGGQGDKKPMAWMISLTEALRAVIYFFEHKDKSPQVSWHNDSQSN